MRMLFIGIVTGLALLEVAGAQAQGAATSPSTDTASQSQSSAAAGNIRPSPGSVIPVRLTKTIDAKKAKKGDQVEAKVTQDLKAQSGDVVVAKDTKFVGHVTEVQTNQDQKPVQLGIAFDYAATKNGSDVSLPVSIQAIIAPRDLNAGNNGAGPDSPLPPIAPPNSPGAAPGNGNMPSARMGNAPPTAPTLPNGDLPAAAQASSESREPITAKTEGVVGIPNLTLSTPKDVSQGSLLSSEKGSIKLESGTLMLLRVNP